MSREVLTARPCPEAQRGAEVARVVVQHEAAVGLHGPPTSTGCRPSVGESELISICRSTSSRLYSERWFTTRPMAPNSSCWQMR
jgi:hypothetical protein